MFLITHSGPFHCDEVTSTAIFTLIFNNIIILRTRDLNLISDLINQKIEKNKYKEFFEKYDEFLSYISKIAVYDVYGRYDPLRNMYDHHQREFKETFYENKFQDIKMSSAGLVFKHFGRQLTKSIMENCKLFEKININDFLDSNRYDEFIEYVYENYFLGIDANDNGINVCEIIKERKLQDIINIYNNSNYFGESFKNNYENITIEFSSFKKESEEKFIIKKNQNISFDRAVKFIRNDIELFLRKKLYLFAFEYEILLKEIENVDEYNNGQIVHWRNFNENNLNDTMFKKKLQIERLPKAKFFIYSPKVSDGIFRIYGAAEDLISYKSKAYLKKSWRGLRDHELVKVSSLENIVFVHSSGFTGGAKDLKTAIKMCSYSLDTKNN